MAAELRELDAGAPAWRPTIDAVGNVIGRYPADDPAAPALILASHYDTVRNGGKYDGRLGMLTALVVVEALQAERRKLPFHVDVIAFSEEEGVRFSAPYPRQPARSPGASIRALLERRDAAGVTMAQAMRDAGLDPAQIPTLARRPETLAGYLEVHIEQGPVLLEEGLPVGIVTHRRRGALRGHDHRRGRACRHRADGAAPRRRRRRGRDRALRREALLRRRRPWSAPSASSRCRAAPST